MLRNNSLNFLNRLKLFFFSDSRTKKAFKNVFFSFGNKIFGLFISFQIIPATIGYVNINEYGIWIAISSIVSWLVYFDLGLTSGFRNCFAKAKSNNDILLARKYVSTTYCVLIFIFFSLMILGLIINNFLDWTSILNLESKYNKLLYQVFNLLVVFFSLQMILNLLTTLLLADHKTSLSGFVVTFGQFLSLVSIYIASIYLKGGGLITLSFIFMGIPALTLLGFTIYFFKNQLSNVSPKIKFIELALVKNILGLGSKFLLVQLCMLFIFQFANFIIIRKLGAESVAVYNIVYKYFSILYVFMGVIFAPFWSAFTEAFEKRDYDWMSITYKKLSKIWFLSIPLYLFLLVLSPLIYENWLAKGLMVDLKLSIAMGVYMLILSRANLIMSCLNGIGSIFIQMVVYLLFALVSIPMIILFSDIYGLIGVIFCSGLVYLVQIILGSIQLRKILNCTSDGFWSK